MGDLVSSNLVAYISDGGLAARITLSIGSTYLSRLLEVIYASFIINSLSSVVSGLNILDILEVTVAANAFPATSSF